ncbi:transposase [Verrucosispora sp. WMMC514]|uniref:RNA-guided endonuclease InsQ/TnpB family protein n=1 Tax=Verrucosispora sp. WMMC514 TaxID=3015156 RepID=UPI00248C9706|nr:transposase [Verrucosispora sp. WMMC514]WBB94174.1 transposase [Verrucosispora sp. WMMC514]
MPVNHAAILPLVVTQWWYRCGKSVTAREVLGMIRMYSFRLYPTSRQRDALTAMLAAHCELYNAALQERRDAYRKAGATIRATQQMAQLTDIRTARPDQAVWSFTSQQQTLRRLDKAFQAFFRRVKAGEKPGYPRFRSAHRFDSVDFRHGDGVKLATDGCSPGHAALRVQGVGTVKVRLHRPLPEGAKLGQVSVKREGSGPRARWHVVLPIEVESEPLPTTGRTIGVDLGVAYLLTASEPVPGLTDTDGHAPNPRHARAAADRLTAAQRALARCKRGSNRRGKARDRVARLHGVVRRQRLDTARKAALALTRHANVIVLEDLRLTNMVRRPKPKPDDAGGFLPNGAAAKAGLNRSVHDAGWGVLIGAVLVKAEEAGREVVLVEPANTSRRCHQCGHTAAGNRVTQAKFQCQACGHVDHADRNAALNILRAGTARRPA